MIDTIRTNDDAIAEARASLEALRREAGSLNATLPALRSDAATLAELRRSHDEPERSQGLREAPTESGRPWGEVRDELRRQLHRSGEVRAAARRAEELLAELEGGRIPDVDDAILTARRKLADVERRAAANASLIAGHWQRIRALDVDAALGKASAQREREELAETVRGLEETRRLLADDRERIAGALEGLLEIRRERERARQEGRRAELQRAWAEHAAAAARAAADLGAAVAELERIRAEWPAILRLASVDWMWEPSALEERVVQWARRLAPREA